MKKKTCLLYTILFLFFNFLYMQDKSRNNDIFSKVRSVNGKKDHYWLHTKKNSTVFAKNKKSNNNHGTLNKGKPNKKKQ